MIYDKNFLQKLDKQKDKVIYARITSLNFEESPIEYIEGRVTQGSINIDGASAVRRSCSLTIVAIDFNYNDYYWGLNTKFELEIGVQNNVDPSYPNIIWFKQGIYLITSFNTSRNTNSFNISIQGKDKMCLLNGEVGGSFDSSIDFGTIEEEDADGNWRIRSLPIQDIIRNLVHTYGKEPYYNIIINDLDTYGLELLEYRYDVPMYLYRLPDDEEKPNVYHNMLFDGTKPCSVANKPEIEKLSDLTANELEMLVDTFTGTPSSPADVIIDGNRCHVAKIEYGQTAGYRLTDLTYPGDLIANIGESITSILDKIKNMLVEFEYFYNLEGQFVFQKKQSFKNSLMKVGNDEQQQQPLNLLSAKAYEFYGGELITTFNNNPNLLNVKNDYSIWGEKQALSGATIPIHLRYAIDRKPTKYTNIFVSNEEVAGYNSKYNTSLKSQGDYSNYPTIKTNSIYTYIADSQYSVDNATNEIHCDWREIIYQMAKDYYRYNFLEDFELRVIQANGSEYPTGRTGYEQYYTDLQGFWRQLYYPSIVEEKDNLKTEIDDKTVEVNRLTTLVYGIPQEDGGQNLGGLENDLAALNNAKEKSMDDAMTLVAEWNRTNRHNILDENNQKVTDAYIYFGLLSNLYFFNKAQLDKELIYLESITKKYDSLQKDIQENFFTSGDYSYWNRAIYAAPERLNFWFDFLDTAGELQQFSVPAIGSRPKAINDTNVKSIYFRETPPIIYVRPGESFSNSTSYRYIQAPDENMFSCSAKGKSAKERLDELLYQHGYCIESATINAIPIYYLQPNTRIYLYDEESGLDGDYILSKLTIPLAYNGTMSLTATKAAENIL